MLPDDQYKRYYYSESSTSYGDFGIRILLKDQKRKLTQPESLAISQAAENIYDAVMTETVRQDPKAAEAAAKEKKELLDLFGDLSIFVKELPNGYCSRWCCKHLPWFEVFTGHGPVMIGWRKSVIHISWDFGNTAEQLFPAENVTKSGRMIHARGLEKAKEYLDKILDRPVEGY